MVWPYHIFSALRELANYKIIFWDTHTHTHRHTQITYIRPYAPYIHHTHTHTHTHTLTHTYYTPHLH